mmetsp:Transcript_20540/g.47890  ORF Transcript_20540/g.47890 Transcript_20540/m.47890 type:complete len:367 (+) Transcript_20540:596-1696(+)
MAALHSPCPVVCVGLDHGIISQDNLHLHIEEAALAKCPGKELTCGFGFFLCYVFCHGEHSDLALPPVPMLRQQPGKENQESAVMDHPPHIDGTARAFDFFQEHVLQAFHCEHGLVCRVGVAQDFDKVLACRIISLLGPVQHYRVGNQSADARQLDDVVCTFGHARSDDDLCEAFNALLGHEILDDLLLLRCLELRLRVAVFRLQDAGHHAEAPAFAKLGSKAEVALVAAGSLRHGRDAVDDEDLRSPVHMLVLRLFQLHKRTQRQAEGDAVHGTAPLFGLDLPVDEEVQATRYQTRCQGPKVIHYDHDGHTGDKTHTAADQVENAPASLMDPGRPPRGGVEPGQGEARQVHEGIGHQEAHRKKRSY